MFVKDLRIAGNRELNVLGCMRSAILETQPMITFLSLLHLWYCIHLWVPPFAANEEETEKIQGKQSARRVLRSTNCEEMLNWELGLFTSGKGRLREKYDKTSSIYICVCIYIHKWWL